MTTSSDPVPQQGLSARPSPRATAHRARTILPLVLVAVLTGTPLPGIAADGCLVLLCLAAPSWRNVPQCVDPVREVLRDLARGHPFPTCSSAGGGNAATNRFANAPSFCPPQYTTEIMLESGPVYSCRYAGAVEVPIDGVLWSRTWWALDGDSVTEYTPAAQLGLGTWDPSFEIDYAAWLASRPAPAAPETGS